MWYGSFLHVTRLACMWEDLCLSVVRHLSVCKPFLCVKRWVSLCVWLTVSSGPWIFNMHRWHAFYSCLRDQIFSPVSDAGVSAE